jgi:hypothetical protein
MREVSAHAQNDDRSVAAEIFAIGSYFPNTPRTTQEASDIEENSDDDNENVHTLPHSEV